MVRGAAAQPGLPKPGRNPHDIDYRALADRTYRAKLEGARLRYGKRFFPRSPQRNGNFQLLFGIKLQF